MSDGNQWQLPAEGRAIGATSATAHHGAHQIRPPYNGIAPF